MNEHGTTLVVSQAWLQLLGPSSGNSRAVVKRNGMDVDSSLLQIEAGHVVLGPHPDGLTEEEVRACVGYARAHMPGRWRGDVPGKGARLVIGRTALNKAFRAHVEISGIGKDRPVEPSALLLAVYAIECGLKSLLIDKRRVKTTAELDEEDLTHDLNALSVEVMQRKLFPENLTLSSEENISPARLHEALRYGQRLKPESQKRAISAAKAAVPEIEERLQ